MKSIYYSMLRSLLANHMRKTRKDLGWTQSQMAEKLELDLRSYSNVENDKSLCSTMTLMLYLLYICPDANQLLQEIKEAMDEMKKANTENKEKEEEEVEETEEEEE